MRKMLRLMSNEWVPVVNDLIGGWSVVRGQSVPMSQLPREAMPPVADMIPTEADAQKIADALNLWERTEAEKEV